MTNGVSSVNNLNLGDPILDESVARWLKWDKCEKTLKEVRKLVDERNIAELKERFLNPRLKFGTAGIRGAMKAGWSHLSELIIVQTSQAMVKYLSEHFTAQQLLNKGVCIGFDARYHSQKFARLSANIFARANMKVYLFSCIIPTPYVAFGVLRLGCAAGIMVTASHNPREDNGFKVFASHAAQITSPYDTCIMKYAANECCEPWKNSWDLADNQLISDPFEIIHHMYLDDACKLHAYYRGNEPDLETLKLAYTPVHGVGAKYVKCMLQKFGVKQHNIFMCPEQVKPDPDFPTAPKPNPEEGMGVWKYVLSTGDKNGCNIAFANDPDADRFQLAEKQNDGTWRIFTGNEIGGLIAWWQWIFWKHENPGKSGVNLVYMLNSSVSSKIVKSMAKVEGFEFCETATGFKNMGKRAVDLRNQGKIVLLAWEEAIGYMPSFAPDKDGVIMTGLFAHYTVYLKKLGLNFASHLVEIQKKYGFHLNRTSYFISPSEEITTKFFEKIRQNRKYPTKIGEHCISATVDHTIGFDSRTIDKKMKLPATPGNQMLELILESGSRIIVRASGTEPKVKYYIEFITAPGLKLSKLPSINEDLEKLEQAVITQIFQAENSGLLKRN